MTSPRSNPHTWQPSDEALSGLQRFMSELPAPIQRRFAELCGEFNLTAPPAPERVDAADVEDGYHELGN